MFSKLLASQILVLVILSPFTSVTGGPNVRRTVDFDGDGITDIGVWSALDEPLRVYSILFSLI